MGCDPQRPQETDLFQRAEERLNRGDYYEATRDYEEFLELYPRSRLAPFAIRRLENIDRELQAVMGRRSSPAPIYIRPPVPEGEVERNSEERNSEERNSEERNSEELNREEDQQREGEWGRSGP